MTLSLSHSPSKSSHNYLEFEKALRAYFKRFAVNDKVALETRYWINVGRFNIS